MSNNIYVLLASALFLFVLFALVGAMVSLFFPIQHSTDARNQGLQRLSRAVITVIITGLMGLLILWINLRLSGVTNWLGIGPGTNPSPTARQTPDLDS